MNQKKAKKTKDKLYKTNFRMKKLDNKIRIRIHLGRIYNSKNNNIKNNTKRAMKVSRKMADMYPFNWTDDLIDQVAKIESFNNICNRDI